MIGFIIPFKPARETKNWGKDNELLRRTLNGILQQTARSFHVFVICTDLPEFEVNDSRISVIKMPYPFLDFEEIPGHIELERRFSTKKLVIRRWDKGRKLSYGALLAKQYGCEYIMAVDSDDLLSNRIVEFVENNKSGKPAGWYIEKGYVYKEGRNYLIKNLKMNLFNGSTHILRADLVPVPDFSSSSWEDFSLFTAHGWLRYRIHELHGEQMLPLPFFGVVYVAHFNNISAISNIVSNSGIKNLIKKIVYSVRITDSVKKEFSIVE